MTERLADIGARIEGIRQLGSVVNAIRGIAAARAQQTRNQLPAVEGYAATIAAAIGEALAQMPGAPSEIVKKRGQPALVLFCAEQGFAGAFSERVLDAAGGDLANSALFIIGSRAAAIAAERGISGWTIAVPPYSAAIPKFADKIADAVYQQIAAGSIDRLDAIFGRRRRGGQIEVIRRRLLPLDLAAFSRLSRGNPALMNLPPEALLHALTMEYLHAELCRAALHAFAAENEARMEAMAAAHRQIDRRLSELQATQRLVRQEEISIPPA